MQKILLSIALLALAACGAPNRVQYVPGPPTVNAVPVPPNTEATVTWAHGARVDGQPTQKYHQRRADVYVSNGYVNWNTYEGAGSIAGAPSHGFGYGRFHRGFGYGSYGGWY